jgi:hypothetical protein
MYSYNSKRQKEESIILWKSKGLIKGNSLGVRLHLAFTRVGTCHRAVVLHTRVKIESCVFKH